MNFFQDAPMRDDSDRGFYDGVDIRPHAPYAHCAVVECAHDEIDLATPTPRQNHLLAALPVEDYERLRPHLELQDFPLGMVVFHAGGRIGYGYFPTTSIVSPHYVMENGSAAAFAIAGNEGLVGMPILMGGDSAPNQVKVQSAGHAYRLRADVLKKEFERGGALQRVLLRYMQALITQMGQTAVCNGHHSIEQRMCRWMLLSLDRISSNELRMTQQQIADILGVRRESVTETATRLQDAGIISYHRGRIVVEDRCGLEARVCECYDVEKSEFKRLLPRRAAN
jgi:CRP-like cAMP-binding protein